MTTSSGSPSSDLSPLPHAVYDVLLRLAPSDLLLFDTSLICQYAAPTDDNFFGQRREQLMGRPAADILPPAANGLRPYLERAAREAEPWRDAEYPFIFRLADAETPYRWSLQIEPVAVDEYRGVLVILHDIRELADNYDRVRAELDELRHHEEARARRLRDQQADLRNLLTPISGYLQVIARRPDVLGDRSVASVIEEAVLPQLAQVVAVINQLGVTPPLLSNAPGESEGGRGAPLNPPTDNSAAPLTTQSQPRNENGPSQTP